MQDPDIGSPSQVKYIAKKAPKSTSVFRVASLSIMAVLLVGVMGVSVTTHVAPKLANAIGISGLVSAKEIKHGSARIVNAQTIPLLSPVNNIDPRPARGGASVKTVDGMALLPEASPQGNSTSFTPEGSGQISLYIVREGDSLSQIASMFGVSVNTIVWANNLTPKQAIKEDMELVILPVSGVKHTVKKGDTLQSIAKQYKGDVDEILQFNGLHSDAALAAGTEILIPGGEVIPQKAPARSLAGGSGPAISGFFAHPVPGATKTQGIHGYNGVDLGAGVGTPVRASAAGTVIVSKSGGWNGGYGSYIVIDHPNGTQTLYAHLSKNIVWSGQSVVQGQVIGNVGNTGRSTGAHLHFEVRGARNPF